MTSLSVLSQVRTSAKVTATANMKFMEVLAGRRAPAACVDTFIGERVFALRGKIKFCGYRCVRGHPSTAELVCGCQTRSRLSGLRVVPVHSTEEFIPSASTRTTGRSAGAKSGAWEFAFAGIDNAAIFSRRAYLGRVTASQRKRSVGRPSLARGKRGYVYWSNVCRLCVRRINFRLRWH